MTATDRRKQRDPTRLAVGAALQRAIMRSGVLTPVAAAGLVSVCAVVLSRLIWGSDHSVEWALRLGVLLLAGSVGSVLDDPTEPMIGSVPTTLLARRMSRLLPSVAVVAVGWGVSVGASGGIPSAALTLMLAGLGIAGVAVGALAALQAPQRAGVATAGFVVAAVFVITRLPDRWTMLPDASSGLDWPVGLRWAGVIGIGLVIVSLASRDPGRPRSGHAPASQQLDHHPHPARHSW